MQPDVFWIDLGRSRYEDVHDLQQRLHAWRRGEDGRDLLLLTEHEPVLTLGRGADPRHLRVPLDSVAGAGMALVKTERGGDITYHGPGQLVAYPILDLRRYGSDVRLHVRRLEETALRLCGSFGLDGRRIAGTPGVWAGEAKIASVGVYVSRWVTMHGIAINIDPDLAHFDLIHPCGLVGTRMTSIASLLGAAPSMPAAKAAFRSLFARVFGVTLMESRLPLPGTTPAPLPTRTGRPDYV